MDVFEQVQSHVRERAWTSALELALRAWDQHPRPELSEAIWRIAGAAARDFPAPRTRTKLEFQSVWLEVAEREPALHATAWLARTLCDKVVFETNVGERRTKPLLERFRALRRRGRSPLSFRAAWTVIETAPFSGHSVEVTASMFGPFLEFVRESKDASLVPRITALLARPRADRSTVRDMLAVHLPTVLTTLRATLAPEADPRWDSLVPEVHVEPPQVPAKSDEAERLVLSDELLERGDPRGEFIALQLRLDAGTLDEAGQRRMRSLLRTHLVTWLGALAPVATRTEFRRGALFRMGLDRNAVTSGPRWADAAQSPVLRTVELLDKHRGNFEHYLAFVNSPMAVSLRRVEILNSKMYELIAPERRAQLTELVLPGAPNEKALRQLETFPSLRRIFFVGDPKPVAAMLAGRPLQLVAEGHPFSLEARLAQES